VSADDHRGEQRSPESRRRGDPDERGRRRPMEKLGELLPKTARRLGLDEPLELAAAMTVWQRIVDERVPEASGACRLVSLGLGVAIVEADAPIVAQEIRLRSPELLASLRSEVPIPIRQLRVTLRHV
jgi:predicted nucleic acid-binding Zn ribbon protein